ncbi:S-adenosyl-L-methionine-dependent methyltransferase [Cladochytrium replicatum]|nr:S-adenosyl-L-methionine-dependent methyltransferase [Cladochytrium replicatum]
MNTRKVSLVLLASIPVGMGTYVSYHMARISKLPDPPENVQLPSVQKTLMSSDDLKGVYSGIAADYDKKMAWTEWISGYTGLRKKLVAKAQGTVLEISAGTGRNLKHYPSTISSLTLTDVNPQMLSQSLNAPKPRNSYRLPIRHLVVDAQTLHSSLMSSSPDLPDTRVLTQPPHGYDTIVSAFSLCSIPDPVASLRAIQRVAHPQTQIYLLEHGRHTSAGQSTFGKVMTWVYTSSLYKFLNIALDKTAMDHVHTWGCWWNRDIAGLVKEADIEIVDIKRKHFGTTLLITAKMGPEAVKEWESKWGSQKSQIIT